MKGSLSGHEAELPKKTFSQKLEELILWLISWTILVLFWSAAMVIFAFLFVVLFVLGAIIAWPVLAKYRKDWVVDTLKRRPF